MTSKGQPQGQVLENLNIEVNGKSEVVSVGGFVGTPIVKCNLHGNQFLILIQDLSEQTGDQVWLCEKCRQKCLEVYKKLNAND